MISPVWDALVYSCSFPWTHKSSLREPDIHVLLLENPKLKGTLVNHLSWDSTYSLLTLEDPGVLLFQEMIPDLDMAASPLCSSNALGMSSSIISVPTDSSHSHPRNAAVNENSGPERPCLQMLTAITEPVKMLLDMAKRTLQVWVH